MDTHRVIQYAIAYAGLSLTVGAAEATAPGNDPFVLHAKALLAEVTDDPVQALALIRQAAALAPSNHEIVFDLARLSLAGGGDRFVEDSEPLLALAPRNTDERLLHAHARFARGELEAARSLLGRVRESNPDSMEAEDLLMSVTQALIVRNAKMIARENAEERERIAAEAQRWTEEQERRRREEDARAQAAATVAAEATDGASNASSLRLELSLLGQYDTNPTVAPNDSGAALIGVTTVESPRIAAEFAVGYTLSESETQLSDLRVSLGYGAYTDTDTGATTSEGADEPGDSPDDFNGITGSLFQSNSFVSGDWLFTVDVAGLITTLNDTEFYSATGVLATNALYDVGLVRVGVYARGGYNYFDEAVLTGELEGADSEEGDRDGLTAAGGVMLMGDYAFGGGTRLVLDATGGYQLERAPTDDFTEAGLEAGLGAALRAGRFSLNARGSYQIRAYESDRDDDLLVVGGDIGFEFMKGYTVRAGYLVVDNASSLSGDAETNDVDSSVFEYTRQVAFAGLEARW